MRLELTLYRNPPERCPYLPGCKWLTHAFFAPHFVPALYEQLISEGFRRSGYLFYQNHCPDCTECLPIRVDVNRFMATTSQRRVLRKNRDVRIERRRTAFHAEEFRLYRNYCAHRHPSEHLPDEEGYANFLIETPFPNEMMRYLLGDRLVGIGWIDVLPHSLSSVYCAFDPAEAARSLGTYSILQQIALCRELGKTWLQLGFWVQPSQKMSYKSRFRPCQVLQDGIWQEL
jgi:leucyl-tRNA---protein transferase